MKFLVFGGGGRIAVLFAALASRSHSVISVVRNSRHDDALKAVGATPALLDIEHATETEVVALLKEHAPDVVIWAAAGSESSPESLGAVDHLGAVKVYAACAAAGTTRILVISTIDARDITKPPPKHYSPASITTSEAFQKAMPDYCAAKYAAEKALHPSELQFTVLRPGALHNALAKGAELGITQMAREGVTSVASISDLVGKILPTSRELVAQVLLACANQPETAGLTLDVMDGNKSVEAEVARCARDQVDAWAADEN